MNETSRDRRRDATRPRLSLLVSIAGALLAFGGGDGGASPTATTSPIAGSYHVTVALADNNCGAVTVLPQPTSVSHKAGRTRFTLRHGSNSFAAPLAADNSFAADALLLQDQDGSTLTVRLAGRFTLGSPTTLDATVTVEVSQRPSPPRSCRYLVRWTGTKKG